MTPVFHTISGAPDPVAPFSHAVESDGWVFITGQMPFAITATDTSIDTAYPEGIEAQTHQVMHNLEIVLRGVGLGLAHVLSVRVFLRHFDEDYERMNAVYAGYFEPGRRPARTCVGVTGLAKGAHRDRPDRAQADGRHLSRGRRRRSGRCADRVLGRHPTAIDPERHSIGMIRSMRTNPSFAVSRGGLRHHRHA